MVVQGVAGGGSVGFSMPSLAFLLRDGVRLCGRAFRVPGTWVSTRRPVSQCGVTCFLNSSPDRALPFCPFPPPDLQAAMEIICDNVGKDWKRLARHLSVSDIKIEAIEEKYPRNLAEQVRELLRVWKNSTRQDTAVSRLVGALRGCQLNVVADLIEEDQRAQARQSGSTDPGPLMAWDSGSAAPGAS